MPSISLKDQAWTLEGWRPFAWRLGRSQETNTPMQPEIGPIKAVLPGSVQGALGRAGILPDWNQGRQSLECEWVEHRHWIFETQLSAALFQDDTSFVLLAEGLDYSGWILVDDQEVGRFKGALKEHRFDLSEAVADKQSHRLSIIFEEPPREQGQIGYTSRSRFFKPRYNYSWDWCPRFVPIGIPGDLYLLSGAERRLAVENLYATLSENLEEGRVHLTFQNKAQAESLVLRVLDGDKEVAQSQTKLTDAVQNISCRLSKPILWWPNGYGEAHTYRVRIEVLDAQGQRLCAQERSVGFRHIAWRACEGAPKDADPWICVVNGKPLFLQGANWTPARTDYPETTPEEYDRLIDLYQKMGATLLRVWGGAFLESEAFYARCDAAGILVWQEFPLSSSGIENTPPEAPEAIEELKEIAAGYIRQRAHHPSLLVWCGGNELTGPAPDVLPSTCEHPCLAALKKVVEEKDPSRRFLPTSSSGPMFYAKKENYGQGLHHDVHGPWGLENSGKGAAADLEAWEAYWGDDDSLFRSEVGVPGAAAASLIRAYAGKEALWPPTNPFWRHSSAWWLQWDRFEQACAQLNEAEALQRYVELTQELQAQAYAIAAKSAKDRFPQCGGFLIWMGHDCFPCPANNSVIDFDRNPKPAYYALKKVFLEQD